MVMPSKCPFCEKTYGDSEQHYCVEWTKDIAEKAKESRENIERWLRINGKYVQYKDGN